MARPETFHDLVNLSENDLARLDIGLLNLICAKGLPGSEDLDVDACLAKLDEWAKEVRDETNRNLRRFRPTKPRDTVGYLKCWTLCKMIRHRRGLRHHLEPVNADPTVRYTVRGNNIPGPESSFRHAEPVFIGGLLGKRGIGSCTSFPALLTALGQRLGYPIKQILVVAHVIIRWDDPNDRFNMDPGPNYINHHPDEYYVDKPVPWTHEEKTCGNWFRPLKPSEELGHFAGLRGCVLEANLRFEEALEMFKLACRLMPKCPLNPKLQDRAARANFLRRLNEPWNNPLSPVPGVNFCDPNAVGAPPWVRAQAKVHRLATPAHPIPSWGARLVAPSRFADNPFATCTVIQNPDKR